MLAKLSLIALLAAALGGEGRYPAECKATLSGWVTPESGFNIRSPINRIRMQRDGSLLWNGSAVTDEQVVEYTGLLMEIGPQPFTMYEIEEGADCRRVEHIRALIHDRVKCAAGEVCGEGLGPWSITPWRPPTVLRKN
jgi:hypothetical protein